jgi:hypothetical protein
MKDVHAAAMNILINYLPSYLMISCTLGSLAAIKFYRVPRAVFCRIYRE